MSGYVFVISLLTEEEGLNRLTTVRAGLAAPNLAVVAVLALAALSGCGGAASSAVSTKASATPTPAPTPSPTPDITTISRPYLAAYDLLHSTLSPLITQADAASIGSTALTTALNAQLAAYQAFDTSVSGIDVSAFPTVAADLRAVTAADAAVENGYGTLVANAGNASNYNLVLASLNPALIQCNSANAVVFKDLGLPYTVTPTP